MLVPFCKCNWAQIDKWQVELLGLISFQCVCIFYLTTIEALFTINKLSDQKIFQEFQLFFFATKNSGITGCRDVEHPVGIP